MKFDLSFPHRAFGRFAVFLQILSLAVFCSESGSGLHENIMKILKSKGYSRAGVGVCIRAADADTPIVSLMADSLFNPASVSKLVTAAWAYDRLGSQYRFVTRVWANGEFDPDSGLLRGDLHIRGGGDPSLTAERMWLFVQHLRHRGLRRIKGDLVLDDSFFDGVSTGPGFGEDCSSRAYEAPSGALSASFNCVAVHQRPGARVGSPVHIDLFPSMKDVHIEATAKTVGRRQKAGMRIKTARVDGKTAIYAFGSMRIDSPPKYTYRKVWETWRNFGRVAVALFDECGITLDGEIRRGTTPDSLSALPPFLRFTSEPLSACVRMMFKYSNNFASEMLLKTVSAEIDSGTGSWARAADSMSAWWRACDFGDTVILKNGSGMGNANRVTPSGIVALLEYIWSRPDIYPDFLSALSTAGIDGTLDQRFLYSPLKGLVRAKTGTLNNYGVSALAGYMLIAGRSAPVLFALLMNDKKQGQYTHWVTQEKILSLAAAAIRKRNISNADTESTGSPGKER